MKEALKGAYKKGACLNEGSCYRRIQELKNRPVHKFSTVDESDTDSNNTDGSGEFDESENDMDSNSTDDSGKFDFEMDESDDNKNAAEFRPQHHLRRVMDQDLRSQIEDRVEDVQNHRTARREKLDGICEELLKPLSSKKPAGIRFFFLSSILNSRDTDVLKRAIQSKEATEEWETALEEREPIDVHVKLLQNRRMQKLSVVVEEVHIEEEEVDNKVVTTGNDEAIVEEMDNNEDSNDIGDIGEIGGESDDRVDDSNDVEWPSSSTCEEEGETTLVAVPPPAPPTKPKKSQPLISNVLQDLGSTWVNGCRRSTRFQEKQGSIILNGLRRSARLM